MGGGGVLCGSPRLVLLPLPPPGGGRREEAGAGRLPQLQLLTPSRRQEQALRGCLPPASPAPGAAAATGSLEQGCGAAKRRLHPLRLRLALLLGLDMEDGSASGSCFRRFTDCFLSTSRCPGPAPALPCRAHVGGGPAAGRGAHGARRGLRSAPPLLPPDPARPSHGGRERVCACVFVCGCVSVSLSLCVAVSLCVCVCLCPCLCVCICVFVCVSLCLSLSTRLCSRPLSSCSVVL